MLSWSGAGKSPPLLKLGGMKNTKIYYGQFSANNGTHFLRPITGRNKEKLIVAVRSAANGERFAGNTASWYVWYYAGGRRVYVAAGKIDRNGRSKRATNDELDDMD